MSTTQAALFGGTTIVTLHTTGKIIITNIATEDNRVVFRAEYGHIKESIVHMNERKESGWINQGEYEESMCRECLSMVQTFIDQWGENMVINDLCVAPNAVEEAPAFTMIPLVDISPAND